ncbi:MAG: biotin/lipoyl-binding protein [Deltaproteobacteria bacterium]|nr:MAG: biotin/lipoyl-binding protein [Deltaproteobacteria bacterium]
MPGQVVKVLVQEGQSVKAGEMLVVMEAMKMEHSISAPKDSKVKKVNFQQGDKVNMGDKLVELE